MTRQGQIYLYRRPSGPAVPADEKIDRWLHQTTQGFDFTPLFNGDQLQARELADHYIRYLKQEARRAKIEWPEVQKRLQQVNPHLRRGFQTFASYFDARVKTGGR